MLEDVRDRSYIEQSAFLDYTYECTDGLQASTLKLTGTTYPGSDGSNDVEIICATQPFHVLATDGENLALILSRERLPFFSPIGGVVPVIVEEVEGPEGDDTT